MNSQKGDIAYHRTKFRLLDYDLKPNMEGYFAPGCHFTPHPTLFGNKNPSLWASYYRKRT
jgi:hypothetical protein